MSLAIGSSARWPFNSFRQCAKAAKHKFYTFLAVVMSLSLHASFYFTVYGSNLQQNPYQPIRDSLFRLPPSDIQHALFNQSKTQILSDNTQSKGIHAYTQPP